MIRCLSALCSCLLCMVNCRAQEALATISKAFGEAHCSLLRINTGNGDPNARGAQPDFFRIHHRPGLPGGGAGERQAVVVCLAAVLLALASKNRRSNKQDGCAAHLPSATRPCGVIRAGEVETQLQAPAQGLGAFLSVSDLEAVSALVRKLAVQTLLPKLEERIGRLNAGITTARRGLRNRITRLWKGAADDTVVDRCADVVGKAIKSIKFLPLLVVRYFSLNSIPTRVPSIRYCPSGRTHGTALRARCVSWQTLRSYCTTTTLLPPCTAWQHRTTCHTTTCAGTQVQR